MLLNSENMKIEALNTKAFIGDQEFGTGLLSISEQNLSWKNTNGNEIVLNYPNIALHAISKDLNAFPHECLYMITDHPIEVVDGKLALKEDDDDDSDDSSEIVPLRFVPQDKSLLSPIFKAINECQALYPDEQASQDSDDSEEPEEQDHYVDENQFFDSSSGLNGIELSDRGQEILRRLNINIHTAKNGESIEEENQYEDAEN